METRNALDSGGNVVGTVSFPEGTPESTWSSALSAYSYTPDPLVAASEEIQRNIQFGHSLIIQFAAGNLLAGLTTSQIITVATELAPIQALLYAGSLTTALAVIEGLTPNSLITADTIQKFATILKSYLGVS